MKIAEKSQTGLEEMETQPKLGELKETLIRDQNYAKLVVDKHREAQLLTTARVPGVGKRCKWPNCYCVTRMQITPSYARTADRPATPIEKVGSHSPVNLRNHRPSKFL